MDIQLYTANRPNLTKYGTQTQILIQPTKHDKHKSEISIKKSKYNFFKLLSLCEMC